MGFLICSLSPTKVSNVVIEVGADGRTATRSLFSQIKTIKKKKKYVKISKVCIQHDKGVKTIAHIPLEMGFALATQWE